MTYHKPVLLEESVDGLVINPDGIYVDVTFGAGGHSRSILNKLSAKGHLYAFDQDADAIANAIDDPRFTLTHSNFRYVRNFLRLYGIRKVDGILADLGVSSHQLDQVERGFTFRDDGPLDMRMNKYAKSTAAHVLNTYQREAMVQMFSAYGEVRNSKRLVTAILDRRENKLFEKIDDLREIVEENYMGTKTKYYAQVFQAVRIEVNQEIEVLKRLMEQSVDLLKEGGRLSVISFHSLEDRVVKKFMKSGNVEGKLIKDDFGRVQKEFKVINKRIIVPTENEVRFNNRARSAKLRIAEKL